MVKDVLEGEAKEHSQTRRMIIGRLGIHRQAREAG